MQYASVDNVVAFAKTLVKDADTRNLNIWREWVYECVKDLGYGDSDLKVCALYPVDGRAALPKDCQQISEVAVFDASGCQLKHLFRSGKRRIYQDNRLLPQANAGSPPNNNTTLNSLVPVDISNDRHFIFLGTNGSEVATILIRYYHYPVDEATGEILIHEEDRMTVCNFILMMEAIRAADNQSRIQLAQQTYFASADRSRARKKAESMTYENAKTLKAELMSLLPLNNLSKF